MKPRRIDPLASVHPRAELGEGVVVGPFAVVGPGVQLADDVTVGPHAVLSGPTFVGARGRIHSHAAVGGPPQDRRHAGEPTTLRIGEDTEIREFATLHRGTARDRGETTVGARVLVMAYAHVAHDCIVGDDVVLANAATLAGHVVVDRFAVLAGLAAVGQHVRVGESAFVAAGAMVERDVPPFTIVSGDRARVRGLNAVGLARRGMPVDTVRALKRAHRALFLTRAPRAERIARARGLASSVPEVLMLVEFVESSVRGVCR
jgi:UDP-N-acetylglucosamine acyltransferase